MIIRHGTRLPSSKDIIGMNTVLMELKQHILNQNELGKGKLGDVINYYIKVVNMLHISVLISSRRKTTDSRSLNS